MTIKMSSVYHDEELKLVWLENKRPAIYEAAVLHGCNRLCCSKIPKYSIVRNKSKLGRKAKMEVTRI